MKYEIAQQVSLPLDRVIPKAPRGVLGAFIQNALHAYVEPTREGTPKGEPVGLSKQKYHAAILCGCTGLELQRIAKEVGVSYPLLRKWRTEPLFGTASQAAAEKFADNYFYNAAKLSFRLVAGRGGDVTVSGGTSPEAILQGIEEQKLIGFDDAAFYSRGFLVFISSKTLIAYLSLKDLLMKRDPASPIAEEVWVQAGEYLSLVYSLDRINRIRKTGKPLEKLTQRQEDARYIALLIAALSRQPVHSDAQYLLSRAAIVLYALLKD